jgi:tight adherence protein C
VVRAVNSTLAGGLVGSAVAIGLLMAARAAPPMRPVRLSDRIAPYVGDAAPSSKLLARPSAASAPFTVLRRLLGPVISQAIAVLDRTVGGAASVRRRLAGLGRSITVEEFRIEQVVWGGLGLLGAAVFTVAATRLHGGVNPILVAIAALLGLVGAVLGRDWVLSWQLRQREATMLAEFPVVADLLALAVVAGEAPTDALARICRLAAGELTRDLNTVLARTRAGLPITTALSELAESTTLEPFARFLNGLVVAIERGTPLAAVLRAQAMDVREAGKRALLEAGGRKEISMMLPVVFLILPVTVLFALYPGLVTIVSLTQ